MCPLSRPPWFGMTQDILPVSLYRLLRGSLLAGLGGLGGGGEAASTRLTLSAATDAEMLPWLAAFARHAGRADGGSGSTAQSALLGQHGLR
jgi:hypothetical protein